MRQRAANLAPGGRLRRRAVRALLFAASPAWLASTSAPACSSRDGTGTDANASAGETAEGGRAGGAGGDGTGGGGGGDGSRAPAMDSPLEGRGGFADLPEWVPDDRASLCRRPLLIGHRGSRLDAPENTLPAFQHAIASGGDGVEIDVRLTADGALIAMHDATTGGTTDDARDRAVSSLTLTELRTLDAGAWFGERWRGTRVPTLDEIVDALPEDVVFVFDLRADTEDAIVTFIERRGIAGRSIAAGFSSARLARVHEALPDLPIAYFLTSLDDLGRATEIGATYARVPISTQEQEWTHWAVINAGFLPIASSTYLTWNLGMVFVNSMANGLARLADRRPAECHGQ